MDYTDEMLRCLRKMSEQQLEDLRKEWEGKYGGKNIMEYLDWLLKKGIELQKLNL